MASVPGVLPPSSQLKMFSVRQGFGWSQFPYMVVGSGSPVSTELEPGKFAPGISLPFLGYALRIHPEGQAALLVM